MTTTRSKGSAAEDVVSHYLEKQGLKELTRNYFCKSGEIDLIMRDNDFLVFVEVRFRETADFGHSLETVNAVKQQRIIKTAEYYLYEEEFGDSVYCRFDVVGMIGNSDTILWVKDAFRIGI